MPNEDDMKTLVKKIKELPKGQNLIYYTGLGTEPVPFTIKKLISSYVAEGIVSQHVRRKDKDNMHFIVQKRI
jgi:hypothetical protein